MQKAVEDQLQYIPSAVAQSALISRLAESGVDLINFESKDIKYKRAGLTIFSSLLDINDDVLPERRRGRRAVAAGWSRAGTMLRHPAARAPR